MAAASYDMSTSKSFNVVSAISCAGSDLKANEDRYGHNDEIAFVTDGATGLGHRQYMDGFSTDAEWFADFATDYLLSGSGASTDIQAVMTGLMERARFHFFQAGKGEEIPRYAWPSASVALITLQEGHIQFAGLGDCTVYVGNPRAGVKKYSALQNFAQAESAFAKVHVAHSKGIHGESLLENAHTLDHLRKARAAHNTPDGNIWTLGLVPEAAERLQQTAIPVNPGDEVLICSDGFSALEETYLAYSSDSLLQAVNSKGLEEMYQELRHIEHSVDPTGEKFPRFKRSDDATALHLILE